MKKFILFIFLAPTFLSRGQAPSFEWAKRMGGYVNDGYGRSVDIDARGNVYTTGFFTTRTDFDPGPDQFYLFAHGPSPDMFISKLDATGNFVWARNMGGVGYARSIKVDAKGNVYTTGHFNNTVDFDPGPGVYNLSGYWNESTAIFISKLDSSGNFVWAKSFDGFYTDQGYSITVDQFGNVYTTGMFQMTCDFDPGPGVHNLTTSGGYEIFVSKLDAAGNFLWAKSMGGGHDDFGCSITVDTLGSVYTTGMFRWTGDFDPGPGTFSLATQGDYNIFISKLDTDGNFVWAKAIGGQGYDDGISIALDLSSNVYTTGRFYGAADFDPGPDLFNLTSFSTGAYISKLSSAGDFIWAKKIDGINSEAIGHSITLDAMGSVYITGNFKGTIDCDPGHGVFNLTGDGMYISKLNEAGHFVWARAIDRASGTGIVTSKSGNVYTTGYFGKTADFDPGPGVFNLTATGGVDIFVHKLSQCSPLNPAITASSSSSMICIGETATLTAGGANTYSWSNGITSSLQIVSPASTSVYVVSGMTDKGCSNIGMVYLLVDPCVGTKELKGQEEAIRIWPNPGTEFLNIELNGNNSETVSLQISNLFGQVVLDEKFENNESSYNISHLPVGIYFVTVTNDKKQNGFKLVKQ